MACKKQYIGSTIQYYHDRMDQHHTDSRSGIFYHKDNEKHINYSYKIISQCQNEVKLRLTEGLLIYKNKPKLNRKHELLDALAYLNI